LEASVQTATRRATHSGALICGAFVAATAVLAPSSSRGEPVAVRHSEGLAHGFVILQTPEGAALADGDLIQTSSGTRVTTRLILRFKDGSRHEETTTYTQRTSFRLVSSHVVQSGPAFKTLKESTIDVRRGQVTIRYTDEGGKEVVSQEHPELPADLANGMTMVLLKNISPTAPKTTVSMLGFTPKPQLVQLEISPAGEETFSIAGSSRKAIHYVVKVHVPGVTGAVASVLGKIPPDSHIWILGGEAPAFVAAETSLFSGGPQWRIELASPKWPSGPSSPAKKDSKDIQAANGPERAPAARAPRKKVRSGMK
jgi:hypothetical protein